jgi:replicative superfamily II helicase
MLQSYGKSSQLLINKQVKDFIAVGVAYHHSGLSMEERELTEHMFKQGFVKVLFCTSTLAAGVNLPAKRVIITSTKVGQGEDLPTSSYKQMIGRAGRLGFDTEADSILIAPDRNTGLRITTQKLDRIESQLSQKKRGLSRILLEAIGIGLA